jgi:hypothetical protein
MTVLIIVTESRLATYSLRPSGLKATLAGAFATGMTAPTPAAGAVVSVMNGIGLRASPLDVRTLIRSVTLTGIWNDSAVEVDDGSGLTAALPAITA